MLLLLYRKVMTVELVVIVVRKEMIAEVTENRIHNCRTYKAMRFLMLPKYEIVK